MGNRLADLCFISLILPWALSNKLFEWAYSSHQRQPSTCPIRGAVHRRGDPSHQQHDSNHQGVLSRHASVPRPWESWLLATGILFTVFHLWGGDLVEKYLWCIVIWPNADCGRLGQTRDWVCTSERWMFFGNKGIFSINERWAAAVCHFLSSECLFHLCQSICLLYFHDTVVILFRINFRRPLMIFTRLQPNCGSLG